MAHATIKRTGALLRTSVHGQLLVPGFGAIVIAAALAADGARAVGNPLVTTLVVQVVLLLCVGLSARSAVRGVAGYDTTPGDVPTDALLVAPRLLSQAALVAAPFAVAVALAMQAANAMPLVGVLAFLLLVPAMLVVPTPLLLAIGAVACGDRRYVPAHAVALACRRPGALQLHAFVLAGLVVAAILTLPLVLVAFVVAAQLGPAAPIAFALAPVAIVPLLGCGSVACWQELGGDELLRDHQAPDDAAAPIAPPGPDSGLVAPIDAWVDGPSWDAALDAGAAWGTWIRMPAPARVALRVAWHAGAAPELALASTDGAWRRPGDPTTPGAPVVVDLDAGDTYVQLTSRAEVPQAISVTLLVPGHAAA